jgi:rhomboid-like protein
LIYGIIGINAAVFGLWKVPKYWRLLSRYALLEKDVMYSKWSIIGSSFSHQEFWHLGVNMLALYSFGTSLATIVGPSMFLQLYLNSGVIASLASIVYPILFKIPVAAASLGASGSLFGVFGTFAYLIPKAKIMLFVFPIPGGAWVAFLGACAWNIGGMFMRWGSFDYAAHLGGSVAGVVYGWWISKKIEQRRQRGFRF